MRSVLLGVSIATLTLMTSPGLAADDFRLSGNLEHRMAAFAGANVRLPLGKRVTRPVARLQLTTTHYFEDRQSGLARAVKAPGLEFGASGAKKPAVFLNGQDMSHVERKLGISGTGKTLLIVGGVAVAGAAAFLLLSDCDACDVKPLTP